jgi:hypothetical protein
MDEFIVETTHFAIALKEMGLLKTRFKILKMIENESNTILEKYTKDDLIMNLSTSFDYQKQLYILSLQSEKHYTTETIVLLYMMEDNNVIMLALASFIVNNQLFDMLLESSNRRILSFAINNNLTIREFLRDDIFRELVYKVAEINENDLNTNVLLLDKIQEWEQVLKMLVTIQKQQIEQLKPLQFVNVYKDETVPFYQMKVQQTQLIGSICE